MEKAAENFWKAQARARASDHAKYLDDYFKAPTWPTTEDALEQFLRDLACLGVDVESAFRTAWPEIVEERAR